MTSIKSSYIIIIDDDVSFRNYVESCVTRLGLKYISFEDGKTAVEFITTIEDKPLAILSDLMMPGGDGIDLLASLCKFGDGSLATIPFIFISAADKNVFESLLKPYPFAKFLCKPVKLNRIQSLLLNLQQGRPAHAA